MTITKRPTLRDVAERAGVSTAAVSLATTLVCGQVADGRCDAATADFVDAEELGRMLASADGVAEGAGQGSAEAPELLTRFLPELEGTVSGPSKPNDMPATRL